NQFDLPTMHEHPRIEFVPPAKIASLRFTDLLSDPGAQVEPNNRTSSAFVAYRPLPASLAGGAGARPDHPISGPRQGWNPPVQQSPAFSSCAIFRSDEAARVHYSPRQRYGCTAARGARAANRTEAETRYRVSGPSRNGRSSRRGVA